MKQCKNCTFDVPPTAEEAGRCKHPAAIHRLSFHERFMKDGACGAEAVHYVEKQDEDNARN